MHDFFILSKFNLVYIVIIKIKNSHFYYKVHTITWSKVWVGTNMYLLDP